MIAAATAHGTTTIQNAALEPEVDDLIALLNKMGGNVKRVGHDIEIVGVEMLHGAEFTISPDRNEVVTFAIAAYVTGGDITVEGVVEKDLSVFLDHLTEAKAHWEKTENGMRFWKSDLIATQVTTGIHPGFMTDWQAPWAVLMTQAEGVSTIHETVYENRFNYVDELSKMGAKLELFNPQVENPQDVYQFNWDTKDAKKFHALQITGPTKLHNAVMTVADLRAGATLVIAALSAPGKSVIYGIDQIDRGYEHFEDRLRLLGATIERSGNKI
jgi:UDP-N-acetylglucosamine 1-carboxyvinyltransferase